MAEREVYNLDPDENSLLWDRRNIRQRFDKFKVKRNPDDVFLVQQVPFVYGLKQDLSTINFQTDDISEIEKVSENTGILCDAEGYPLFSETLLKNYGVGFLLSNWIERKSGVNKFIIRFKRNYVNGQWYNSEFYTHDMPYDIYLEDIYSYKNFIKYQYEVPYEGGTRLEYLIPNLFKSKDGTYQEGIEYENRLRMYLSDYDSIDYNRNPYSGSEDTSKNLSDEKWKKLLLSRKYPASILWECRSSNNVNSLYQTTMNYRPDNKLPTRRQFVVPEIRTNINGEKRYFFYICQCYYYGNESPTETKIDRAFRIAKADKTHPLVPVENFVFWKPITEQEGTETVTNEYLYQHTVIFKDNKTYAGNSYNRYFPITITNPNVHDYNHWDLDNTLEVEDSNGVSHIKRELKYVEIHTKTLDVHPYMKLPNTEKPMYKNFIQYAFDYDIVNDYETIIQTQKPVDEIIEEALNDESIKWQTPAEYYSSKTTVASTTVENPFDITERTWFWVESIKNWCRYEAVNSIMYLTCWNGIDGWDSLETIMATKQNMDFERLARSYLYHHKYFIEGPAFPNDRWGVYVPLRYNTDTVAAIYYRTMVLTQDTSILNYNNKFQNMHDTKIYQTGERNDISNVGMNLEGVLTDAGNPIPVDNTRPAIHGIPTQYCPVIFKQANGNIGLSYIYYVVTNGQGITETDFPFYVISPDEANIRCKEIFGDGADKTITKDWKRTVVNTSEEYASDIYKNTVETIYGAENLNVSIGNVNSKINTMIVKANRPNPTTKNEVIQDYLERWDR